MPPQPLTSRIHVNLENFSTADELENEKKFVENMFGNSLSSWKYGEVDKIDGRGGQMAASFAAKRGTYVLFNSPEVNVKPRLHRRDILGETYRKAVGKELNTLKLFVTWRIMNFDTRTCFANASNVILGVQQVTIERLTATRTQQGNLDEAQGAEIQEAEKGVLENWLSVRPDQPGWYEMGEQFPKSNP